MKYILGIDVGGTKIAAGLVDENFRVTKITEIPTSQTDLLGQLKELVKSYEGFVSIGLGVPGQVLADGTVVKLPNIKKFRKTNLKRVLGQRFRVPVSVINDTKAFTLAEARIGSGAKLRSVAGMILGTGVAVGFVNNGDLRWGKDGLAGELEHVILPDGKMLRSYRKAAGVFTNKNQTKNILRTLLSLTVLSFNPDIIVLGGGWSKLPGMEPLANQLVKNIGGYQSSTPVKVSKLKYPGIIGAALPLLKK